MLQEQYRYGARTASLLATHVVDAAADEQGLQGGDGPRVG